MYVQWRRIPATGKIKDRCHENEAVKVARQPGPEAEVPPSHVLSRSQSNLTASGEGKERKRGASLSRRSVALCDGMDPECVAGIRKQWWRW